MRLTVIQSLWGNGRGGRVPRDPLHLTNWLSQCNVAMLLPALLLLLVLELSIHQSLTQTRHKPCSSLNARNLLGFSNATMALAIYVLTMHLYTYSSKQCIISPQATYFVPSCSRVNQPSRKPILELKSCVGTKNWAVTTHLVRRKTLWKKPSSMWRDIMWW